MRWRVSYFSQGRGSVERINLKVDNSKSNQSKVRSILRIALTEEELGSLLKSKHFSDFFNQSTKLLEKVLDRGDGDMLELMLEDSLRGPNQSTKDILTPAVKFFDAHYTKNRVVTSLDWSPQIP